MDILVSAQISSIVGDGGGEWNVSNLLQAVNQKMLHNGHSSNGCRLSPENVGLQKYRVELLCHQHVHFPFTESSLWPDDQGDRTFPNGFSKGALLPDRYLMQYTGRSSSSPISSDLIHSQRVSDGGDHRRATLLNSLLHDLLVTLSSLLFLPTHVDQGKFTHHRNDPRHSEFGRLADDLIHFLPLA